MNEFSNQPSNLSPLAGQPLNLELEARVKELESRLAAAEQKIKEQEQEQQQAESRQREADLVIQADRVAASASERLQKELAAQKALFDAVLDQLPVGVSISDVSTSVGIYHNREAVHLLGHPMIEKEGISRYKKYHAIHPDGRPYEPEEYPTVRAIMTGERIREEEMLYRREDGSIAILMMSSTPVFDENGKPLVAVSIFYDISERKRAEQALRTSEERFRWVLENSLDVAYRRNMVTDSYDYMSPVVEQVLGFTPEEMAAMLGDEVMERIHPDDRASVVDQLAVAQQRGKAKIEYRFRCKFGNYRWLADYVMVEKDQTGALVYRGGIIRDITEQKRAEAELAENARKLERSNQELQDFAYVASHDLREPLRKVKAFGDSLKQSLDGKLTSPENELLERLIKASDRMQAMIEDLLELSRVTSQGQPFRQVKLGDAMEDVISDLEVAILKVGGRVEVKPLPQLDADPMQVQRLFLNLIGNALKYHRENVPPVIRISGDTIRLVEREYVQVRVEDNGIGFDMQELDRIFQPFQRLHGRSRYEGTGMGLAICKKIVERHGGTITAESEPGKGSIFIVTLPARNR